MEVLFLKVDPAVFNYYTLKIVQTLTALIFVYGLIVTGKAWWYTRGLTDPKLEEIKGADALKDDIFIELVVKTLNSTTQKLQDQGIADPFIHDATRQASESILDYKYLDKIAMSANLLPPIGLWGTVCGMMVIFLGGDATSAINRGALSTKLNSTFVALIFYITLEVLCMWMRNRGRGRINDGLAIKIDRKTVKTQAEPAE